MKFLLLLLRWYPRDFRVRFELEMIQTLVSAREDTTGVHSLRAFIMREAASILRGLATEWLLRWCVDDRLAGRIHGFSALTAAIAIQGFAYGVLLPIGPIAAKHTCAWFYTLAACGLLLTAMLEGCCAIVRWKQEEEL